MLTPWKHRKDCATYWCYCVDEMGDPICACGCPEFMCQCRCESCGERDCRGKECLVLEDEQRG